VIHPIEQFRTEILAAGLTAPEFIHTDGKLHRFSTSGKPSDKSGWYVFHPDGVPAGEFGCWRKQLNQKWCAKSQDAMTQAEREAHRQRLEGTRKQREADAAERHQQAAAVAKQRWQAAKTASEHPYLGAKGVKAHDVKQEGEALLIPMWDTADTLHSLQVIDTEGGKRFQPGGRVKGCYHAIGKPNDVLIVCEGYATGASIHEATGNAVAVAFNAGNLEAVALALHQKYPGVKLILAADDDWKTEANPGMTKAKAAALAVGGWLAVPTFPAGRPDKATDFNDLHQLAGSEAVKACIDAASPQSARPDPVPLPDALPPVAPFDPELLPEALRDWVADIAHRMQCPPDFPAVGAVVAISSLIGARAVVAPKARDDWRVVPNLWGLIVGRPGVMKSPALGEVLKPLHRLEAT
jgi:putative DNA primase/helicase